MEKRRMDRRTRWTIYKNPRGQQLKSPAHGSLKIELEKFGDHVPSEQTDDGQSASELRDALGHEED